MKYIQIIHICTHIRWEYIVTIKVYQIDCAQIKDKCMSFNKTY